MNRKKELCRNFQRGSCQYGDRCRYLHVAPQQQRFNFAFDNQSGSQFNQQQPKPNPFGFGVQDISQSKTFKPFENKWTRSSPIAPGSVTSSRQTDTQPHVVNHKCTNPESCKQIIADDFEHERPLWKLTCYGHSRSQPCDIYGDMSYEELRAAAYQDGKLGISLKQIVERERNLLNSKLVEFENLLRKPYVIPSNSGSSHSTGNIISFPATNASPAGIQNNIPMPVSSFSQLSSMTSLNSRPSAPSNSLSGSPAPNPFQISNQSIGGFGISNPTLANSGVSGQQQTRQSGNATFIDPNLKGGAMTFGSSSSFAQVSSSPISSSADGLLITSKDSHNDALKENMNAKVDKATNIWLKDEWKRGEIPEEPPPDAFI